MQGLTQGRHVVCLEVKSFSKPEIYMVLKQYYKTVKIPCRTPLWIAASQYNCHIHKWEDVEGPSQKSSHANRLALKPPPSSISNFHLHPSACVLLTVPEHRAGAHPADDNQFSCRTISEYEFPPERTWSFWCQDQVTLMALQIPAGPVEEVRISQKAQTAMKLSLYGQQCPQSFKL
ncbi:hypothetical protein CIB84_003397 [Bambusicola thoracicus]|uniref:Uncharacterized protein n=1 Tax=Bambusicola thoracicus TaxID=9083 RepID=A0A2P4T921_BAMTH|nr:hypothetical protein CIB84_003397 [Bambusicola thoracicus]